MYFKSVKSFVKLKIFNAEPIEVDGCQCSNQIHKCTECLTRYFD